MIELSKIAAIAGQGGLFQIKTPLKNGVMMESLDSKKTKVVAGATSKVSILSEISIYTQTAEGAVSLESVLKSLHAKYGKNLPVNPKSDGSDLKALLESVLPEVDMARVYVSDIKKLVSWYLVLQAEAPELFEEKKQEEPMPAETQTEAMPVAKKAKEKAPKADSETAEPQEKTKKSPAKKKA